MDKTTSLRRKRCVEHLGSAKYQTDGVAYFFPGGRRCICGQRVKHVIVLTKVFGDGAGSVIYLGQRCAVSVLAYQSGGMDRFNGNGRKDSI